MLSLALVLAATVPLPADIHDHYGDFNFVNAFSTQQERRLIADVRRQPPGSERLARIARAMERLSARIVDHDPGIMGGRPPAPESAFRSELLRVRSFEIDEARGEAWVQLEALRLAPPAEVTLIARFDELTAADKRPTIDELLAAAGRPYIETLEIQHWLRVDGQWRREAAVRQFVELQKPR
jgi:hypothetical protein